MAKEYLGDSVYVELEDGMLKLTTENGLGANNTIYLDPAVFASLLRYAQVDAPAAGEAAVQSAKKIESLERDVVGLTASLNRAEKENAEWIETIIKTTEKLGVKYSGCPAVNTQLVVEKINRLHDKIKKMAVALNDADIMAVVIDVSVKRGELDARSPIVDARKIYSAPRTYHGH